MKIVGRILLIGVGIALIVLAIPLFREALATWNGDASIESWVTSKPSALGAMIGQAFNMLCGLIAIIGGLMGKKSFKLALIAVIMMIFPIYTLVTSIQAGQINGVQPVLAYVGQFALPILYFIGFLLV